MTAPKLSPPVQEKDLPQGSGKGKNSLGALLAAGLRRRHRPLGELLIEDQHLTEEELQEALIYQKANPGKKLGTILQELGWVSSLDLMETLIRRMKIVKAYGKG